MYAFSIHQLQMLCIQIQILGKYEEKYGNKTKGSTLWYKIGREAKQPPIQIKQKLQANSILTWNYFAKPLIQEYDLDMADSNSPPNLKRTQLQIQLSNQQKKTRSDFQSDHTRYANQDIWLGFQTMELIAAANDAPLQEIHTFICEMIRSGYKESEAAEAHTTKISFSRVPQQTWPNTRMDGQTRNHYHLT